MSKLICLSGWRRSGKDTVGNYLSFFHNYSKLSFAEKLKDVTSSIFDVERKLFDDDLLKDSPLTQYPVEDKTDPTSITLQGTLSGEFRQLENSQFFSPRTLCILMGSVGRTVKNDFWVEKTVKDLSAHNNYVITDLRYRNELDSLYRSVKFHEIVSIRINRFDTIDSNNSSERDLDDYAFDHYLNNTDSIKTLYKNLDDLIKIL